jgi:hypothetical protein
MGGFWWLGQLCCALKEMVLVVEGGDLVVGKGGCGLADTSYLGLGLSYGPGNVVCRPLVDLVLNISKCGLNR